MARSIIATGRRASRISRERKARMTAVGRAVWNGVHDHGSADEARRERRSRGLARRALGVAPLPKRQRAGPKARLSKATKSRQASSSLDLPAVFQRVETCTAIRHGYRLCAVL